MTTRNRGKRPKDDQIFADKWLPVLRSAVDDYCFLLTRGYTENSITQFVGNRYKLNSRQRKAIRRISASEQQIKHRKHTECQADELKNAILAIDGFNLLILLESALSGAYIFKGRDGAYRDLSSVHGSYKRVQKTQEAILLVGKIAEELKVAKVQWYFDQPVSNSGLLKSMLLEISGTHHFDWEVELVHNPDKILVDTQAIAVTSDSWVLDQVKRWFNLGASLVEQHLKEVAIIAV